MNEFELGDDFVGDHFRHEVLEAHRAVDFVEEHAELLSQVRLSSVLGGRTLSLQERQMDVLREKLKVMELRMAELMRIGQENDRITHNFQAWTRDLLLAMREDGIGIQVIRVDGGMVGNRWFLQFLADILGITVERPVNIESTVLGAACIAALQSGLIESPAAIGKLWQRESVYEPRMDAGQREQLYAGWLDAVSRVRSGR